MNRLFITTALTMSLIGGAVAQTTTPSAPAANASRTNTTLAPTEFTTGSLVGVAMYAPKAMTTTASTPMATPASAGSMNSVAPSAAVTLSDADFKAMRDNHDNIGDVNNIVLGADGRLRQVVLGVGGFLGIGEKSVAVDWTEIRWVHDSNGKLYGIVQRTKDQLQAAPRFIDRT